MAKTGETISRPSTRSAVRTWAAAIAVAIAVVYVLIGTEIARISPVRPEGMDLLTFGLGSGIAYLVLAALLLATDRRWLETVGALLTLITIVMYFVVAPTRTPMYEPWGLALKVMQAALLAGLVRLVVRPARDEGASRRGGGIGSFAR